ncbi:hypothetical protein EUTSA_v10022111mg, partial [Eutrema salsugineum]
IKGEIESVVLTDLSICLEVVAVSDDVSYDESVDESLGESVDDSVVVVLGNIDMFMFALLIMRLKSTQAQPPCTMERLYDEFSYCADSLMLGTPWVPPSKNCCEYIQIDSMSCFCKDVNKDFSKFYDVNKLFKISHECGNLLIPGSFCG